MDIAPGSLYRLEGWALRDRDFNINSYRDRDPNWQRITFEGMFLDPSDNPSANQSYSLTDYVASIVHHPLTNRIPEHGKAYILFLVPQDCDAIDPADDFPEKFDSYSADPESDCKSRDIQVFICRDKNVMSLDKFEILKNLGLNWDEALENNMDLFLPLNPQLKFSSLEPEDDLEISRDTPDDVKSFIKSVANCLIDTHADRPEWFRELEQAAGAGVLSCAEQAGFPEMDILDLLYFVQESNDAAAQLVLNRLNTPVESKRTRKSGLDTTQALAFFRFLRAEANGSKPHAEWYIDLHSAADSAASRWPGATDASIDALVSTAKKAGYNITIEEFDEVLSDPEEKLEEEEYDFVDWCYMYGFYCK